jgi:hypothetical protein
MIRTKPLVLCAVIVTALLSPTLALAKERHNRPHRIPAPILDPARDDALYSHRDTFGDALYNLYFGEPVLYGSYHGDGSRYFVRQRSLTPSGRRIRPVQICG